MGWREWEMGRGIWVDKSLCWSWLDVCAWGIG